MRSELYDKRGDIGAFFATLATEITKIGLINGVRRPGILIYETLRDSYYVRLHTIPSPLPQPLDPSCGYIMLTLFIRFFCFYIGVILRFKTSVSRLVLFVCEKSFVSLLEFLESWLLSRWPKQHSWRILFLVLFSFKSKFHSHFRKSQLVN